MYLLYIVVCCVLISFAQSLHFHWPSILSIYIYSMYVYTYSECTLCDFLPRRHAAIQFPIGKRYSTASDARAACLICASPHASAVCSAAFVRFCELPRRFLSVSLFAFTPLPPLPFFSLSFWKNLFLYVYMLSSLSRVYISHSHLPYVRASSSAFYLL